MPTTDGVALRRSDPSEADAVADLYLRVRQDNIDRIPAVVHSDVDVRAWVREVLFRQYDVWVADRGGAVVGMMVLAPPDGLEHLYLDSSVTGSGLGSRLVTVAKQELDGMIQLWTFQANEGAQRFYARHGFVPVEWTEGDNEEGEPDVRLVFTQDARSSESE
ncbi:MAG: GNAT family N-acetyltransferase [Nocardioidaceae bacterium]